MGGRANTSPKLSRSLPLSWVISTRCVQLNSTPQPLKTLFVSLKISVYKVTFFASPLPLFLPNDIKAACIAQRPNEELACLPAAVLVCTGLGAMAHVEVDCEMYLGIDTLFSDPFLGVFANLCTACPKGKDMPALKETGYPLNGQVLREWPG